MKKLFWSLFGAVFLFSSAYLFRHFFYEKVFEIGLQRLTGEKIAYRSKVWAKVGESEKLIYRDFVLGELLYARELTCECDGTLKPLYLRPKIHLESPVIPVNLEEPSLDLAFLLPTDFGTIKLDVTDGSLVFPEAVYGFNFVSGEVDEEIGMVAIDHLLTCDFRYENGTLKSHLEMDQTCLDQVTGFQFEGLISAHLDGEWDGNHMRVQGDVALTDFRWQSGEYRVKFKEAQTAVDFQDRIESLTLSTTFKEAAFSMPDFQITEGSGALYLKPGQLSTLQTHAKVKVKEVEKEIDLHGKGEIHSRAVYWMEGDLISDTIQTAFKLTPEDLTLAGTFMSIPGEIEVVGPFDSFHAHGRFRDFEFNLDRNEGDRGVQGFQLEGVYSSSDLPVISGGGNFTWNGSSIECPYWRGMVGGIEVEGDLVLRTNGEAHFLASNVNGPLESLYDCGLKGNLTGFEFHYGENEFSIEHLQGTVQLFQETPAHFEGNVRKGDDWVFDAKGFQNGMPLFSLKGKADSEIQGTVLLQAENLFENSVVTGSLNIDVLFSGSQADYKIAGSDIGLKDSTFKSVQIHLTNQEKAWALEEAVLDEYHISGNALQEGSAWTVPRCNIRWRNLQLHTLGKYENETAEFQYTGVWNSQYLLSGSGRFLPLQTQLCDFKMHIDYGISPIGDAEFPVILYQEGEWEIPAFQANFISTVHFWKIDLQLGQVEGSYKAPYLQLKTKAVLNNKPVFLSGKFSPEHQFGGLVHVQKDQKLLKVSLSDYKTVDKIQGELFGLAFDLVRDNTSYKGAVSIQETEDFSGIQLKGEWKVPLAFQGELEGKKAVIKDFLIEKVHAEVEYDEAKVRLKNLTLQDPAGSLIIKECLGEKVADSWKISIPLLKGQDIKPSALRKQGEPAKELKPFLIRHLVVTNLTGDTSDLNTFEAAASFNFTQRVNKEPSLFDIPMNLLKDLGVDLDLFTPVMGEANVKLRQSKLYLTDLQNAFSEGKRSEFYLLSGKPSFMDLSGQLSLHLRMQQNVFLKFAEPFVLTVQGTWEKPKYSLRYKN